MKLSYKVNSHELELEHIKEDFDFLAVYERKNVHR